jgi:signal transduction histidine kinase
MGMALYLLERNARRLESQNVKLLQLDVMKTNFLSTVSHELRTPLTCIMGYLELMHDGVGGPLTKEQGDFVGGMQRGADQLSELVNSLLDSAQIERGTLKVERRRLDLLGAIDEALRTLAPLCEKKGLTLERELPASLPMALGDPRRVIQVINNLVGNAIKFTPEGGRVHIALAPAGSGVLAVVVSDTGPGIPEEARTRIFEPFFQADNSLTRVHGGSGLGLPIARSLVEAMGGSLTLERQAGTGAVFRFTLPAETPELRAALQSAQASVLS